MGFPYAIEGFQHVYLFTLLAALTCAAEGIQCVQTFAFVVALSHADEGFRHMQLQTCSTATTGVITSDSVHVADAFFCSLVCFSQKVISMLLLDAESYGTEHL